MTERKIPRNVVEETMRKTAPIEDNLKAAAQQLRNRYAEAISQVANEFDEEEMSKEIVKELQQHKRAAVMTLLGMEYSFGEWSVRRGGREESPIADQIAHMTREAASTWLRDQLETVKKKNKAKLDAALEKAFTAALMQAFSEYDLRQYFKPVVEDMRDEMVREFCETLKLTQADKKGEE